LPGSDLLERTELPRFGNSIIEETRRFSHSNPPRHPSSMGSRRSQQPRTMVDQDRGPTAADPRSRVAARSVGSARKLLRCLVLRRRSYDPCVSTIVCSQIDSADPDHRYGGRVLGRNSSETVSKRGLAPSLRGACPPS
jgi:hypothetical protein